jgi:hypothetical protein
MKKTMKKAIMMIALLAVPFAMQAQTKFHDVEVNEATGPVKSISTSFMGQNQVTNFTQDGKMENGMTDAVYDADGYLQSAKREMRGEKIPVTFKWENGKVVSQKTSMMGNDITITYKYNENGVVTNQSIDMGGKVMDMPYKDIKCDDHGNWISRKSSMMGQEMEQTRKIEYYE